MKSCLDIEYAGTTLAIEEEGGKAHLGSGRTGSGGVGGGGWGELQPPLWVFEPPPGCSNLPPAAVTSPRETRSRLPKGPGPGPGSLPPPCEPRGRPTGGGLRCVCVVGIVTI